MFCQNNPNMSHLTYIPSMIPILFKMKFKFLRVVCMSMCSRAQDYLSTSKSCLTLGSYKTKLFVNFYTYCFCLQVFTQTVPSAWNTLSFTPHLSFTLLSKLLLISEGLAKASTPPASSNPLDWLISFQLPKSFSISPICVLQ